MRFGVSRNPRRAPQGQPVKIAIANFGPHPQLRLLADNFKAAILAAGINAQFDEDHVNFDRTLVPQLLNKLASHDPDLMLTITTPLTQTAKQVLANRKFPIVFAPVTDPVRSKVLASWDHGDPLMVGASNMPDLDATCEFIKSCCRKRSDSAFSTTRATTATTPLPTRSSRSHRVTV